MSRVGKNPIKIPQGVEVKIDEAPDGQLIHVKGPKGELQAKFRKDIMITEENDIITLKRKDDEKYTKSLHGTYRAHIKNMIKGVTDGFKEELDIVGVGYRAQMQGDKLTLQVGYSSQLEIKPKEKNLKVEVDKNQTRITVTGTDKQSVGDLAALIRSLRPPEPYKGKGIKYTDEIIRRKVGKTAVKK